MKSTQTDTKISKSGTKRAGSGAPKAVGSTKAAKAAAPKAKETPSKDKAERVKKSPASKTAPPPKAEPAKKPVKAAAESVATDPKAADKKPSKGVAKKVKKKVGAKPDAKAPAGDPAAAAASEKPAKKPAKKSDDKAAPAPASAAPADGAGDDADKKGGRKGITVVTPAKKPPSKGKPVSKYNPPVRPMLLGPGSKFNKPLIPSGPSAPKPTAALEAPKSKRTKTPLSKQKLEKYRGLLIAKRAELRGDVVSMENEALRSESGGLSNTPQHLAEQGSETYDQSLSLNLAAQDRRVIREIDEALVRIDEGTYGLCELTNQPIPEERLDEIPWARYTIEAARQLESRGSLL